MSEQPPQEWTCKDGVVYFAAYKGWPMRYKEHALEVVNAHNAALAAVTKQRDDFRRALEQRIGEMDESRPGGGMK